MTTIKDKTYIPKDVWKRVKDRDRRNGWVCCVYCGRPARDEEGNGLEEHHFIPRSLGGLGIEENLVNLCRECHTKIHAGDEFINEYVKEYLFLSYREWDEEMLKWRKK